MDDLWVARSCLERQGEASRRAWLVKTVNDYHCKLLKAIPMRPFINEHLFFEMPLSALDDKETPSGERRRS